MPLTSPTKFPERFRRPPHERCPHPRVTNGKPTTFREAFCARHDCDAAHFKKALLRACLPFRARLLAVPLGGLNGKFFAPDRDLVYHIGEATTIASIREEIRDFFMHTANTRWLRREFGVRISTRRILTIARRYLLGSGSADNPD